MRNEQTADDITLPRILVAEDDPISRSLLELYLEQEGYSFVSMPNGRKALESYENGAFQVVITDWLMPEMDGTDLCRAIRALSLDRYTYVILLTSKNSSESLVEGLEAGADDYIIKPINPAELKVRLKGARRILDLEDSLQQSLAEIKEISIRDPLTGAFNRGYLNEQLEREIQRARRYQHPLSVIICDLDHFKSINDGYGHQTGDDVLRVFVKHLCSSIRHNIDWVARYGGEEFVIALPETNAAGCMVVAERMRKLTAETPFNLIENIDDSATAITVTASFGIVTFLPDEAQAFLSSAELVQRADKCLYQAKQTGRNRIVAHISDFEGDKQ